MTVHHNSINPTYSRPLEPPFSQIREKNLILNLALPTSELIDFIEKVKMDYDNNPSFFLTLKEFQGKSNRDKVVTQRDSSLSKQEKVADMLYTYDCLKLGYSQQEIRNSVYNYYMDKGIDTKTFSFDTLRKYRDIAIDYIDNFRYKELVLGTK